MYAHMYVWMCAVIYLNPLSFIVYIRYLGWLPAFKLKVCFWLVADYFSEPTKRRVNSLSNCINVNILVVADN